MPLEPTELTNLEVAERGTAPRRNPNQQAVPGQLYSPGSPALGWLIRIDFATTLDWHERRTVLRTTFPLAGSPTYAVRECAFGVVHQNLRPDRAEATACFEVPAHRFVDVGDGQHGMALLNDGRYGHSLTAAELGLTLLRSPVFPDPTADEGSHSFTYALLPHRGDWVDGGVLTEADDLNRPLSVSACRADEGGGTWSALHCGGKVALGALKASEDGDDLVLRVYNPRGVPTPFECLPPEGWRVTSALNLLEEDVDSADQVLRPYEMRSVRLRRTALSSRDH